MEEKSVVVSRANGTGFFTKCSGRNVGLRLTGRTNGEWARTQPFLSDRVSFTHSIKVYYHIDLSPTTYSAGLRSQRGMVSRRPIEAETNAYYGHLTGISQDGRQ